MLIIALLSINAQKRKYQIFNVSIQIFPIRWKLKLKTVMNTMLRIRTGVNRS